MNIHEFYHLQKRAFLSASPKFSGSSSLDKYTIVERIFSKARESKPLTIQYPKAPPKPYKELTALEKRQFRKMNRQKLLEYNQAWFNRMCTDYNNLRERMVLFWANHFVVMSRSIKMAESFNNTLRKHALGNFKELTLAIAKEAAMINYLDNNKNTKRSPNENFARELMELFTLGRDVLYTENDVKEAAKAFTGWRVNREGEFVVAKRKHDESEKTFLGKQGNFSGEDIIDIILSQKECARYICTKIYEEFVNRDSKPKHINEMVEVFFPEYNIEKLMYHVFMSKWFYDEENRGNKIKSPVELLISIYQLFPFEFKKHRQLMGIQRNLSQVLLQPPNVAGWPGGKQWIDSSTLMLRLRLASLIVNNGEIDESEPEPEEMQKKKRRRNFLKVTVDESNMTQILNMNEDERYALLFGNTPQKEIRKLFADNKPKEKMLKMLSVPDFQLC